MPDQIEKPLSESLESGDGFVAPRYRSGQRSADALLDAGRTLLADISFEALSINDLCSKASLTKGAFYRRFESKDAFFLALQRLALDDAERIERTLVAGLNTSDVAAGTLFDALHPLIDAIRTWHLTHCGVIRASLQRRDHTSDGWRPFKEFARGFIDELANVLMRRPEMRGSDDARSRLMNGFQIAIATMVNAALNDPGPLRLDEPAMTEALTQMLALYVAAAPPATATTKKIRC